jgi:hypothetical protein
MNHPHSPSTDSGDRDQAAAAAGEKTAAAELEQKKLAIVNLFRLLETDVQTAEFKIAGQIVVLTQEIVGAVLSAKTEFERGHLDIAVQELTQAAENFRHKSVRWESEVRAAQAGQRQLTDVQKRQLRGEVPAVRTSSRKTQIFFDRLLSSLEEWSRMSGDHASPAAPPAPAEEPAPRPESPAAPPPTPYQRTGYVPEDEAHRKASASVADLTLLVGQQFEELDGLFRKAAYRDVERGIRAAWDAFREGAYPRARTRLDEAHQLFLQLAATKRVARADAAEQHFRTVIHGLTQIEEAAEHELHPEQDSPADAVATDESASQASDPRQDLRRLREILRRDLQILFPPGPSRQHVQEAENALAAVLSGQLADLPGPLRSLRHAINMGADNNAAQTSEARRLIRRLLARQPETAPPASQMPIPFELVEDEDELRDELETDEDGVTLNFALLASRTFQVPSVDIREPYRMELKFRNTSGQPVALHVQAYNAAGEPILCRPETVRLRSTDQDLVSGHIDGLAHEVAATTQDTRVVLVKFTEVAVDVEIAEIAFRRRHA